LVARSIKGILVVMLLSSLVLASCTGGPSKSEALDIIQKEIKEDAPCTLPLDVIQQLKMQYTTKAACVPNEASEKTRACIDALVTASITQPKPQAYMVDWEDSATMSNVYDRHARNIIFRTCVELGELRDGRFGCAQSKPERVLKVKPTGDTTADVYYERELAFRPSLANIEKACGTVTRPPAEVIVQFTKASGKWSLAPPQTQ
jgi:hypothetical protein